MFIPIHIMIILITLLFIITALVWFLLLRKLAGMFEQQNKNAIELANKKYNENVAKLKGEVDRVMEHAETAEDIPYWEGFKMAIDLLRKATDVL